jgi:hypothetical protein
VWVSLCFLNRILERDSKQRISRSTKGELRVFCKVKVFVALSSVVNDLNVLGVGLTLALDLKEFSNDFSLKHMKSLIKIWLFSAHGYSG